MPWVHRLLKWNFLVMKFVRPTSVLASRTIELLQLRGKDENPHRDYYAGFLEAQAKHPDLIDQERLVSYPIINIGAGADTVNITTRAIIYYTLKSKYVLAKVRKELDANITTYPPDYKTLSALPYLSAVIKEGFRMHPISSVPSERLVPETGLELPDGRRLPPGIKVSMTPWTMHFNKSIYGEDANCFRPERWLQDEKEDEDSYLRRLKAMRQSDLTFMVGSRACLGRHLAAVEVWKSIATLFGCLDMELARPNEEWVVQHHFFSTPSKMDVHIRWREGVDREMLIGH